MILLCPPLAFVFGVAGLSRDDNKLPALVALLIAGAFVAYFLVATGILFRMH